MAVIPAVTAGISVISGVAGISAKNREADAQRAQISAQSYQQAMSQMATEATLAAQQQAAQTAYQTGILAKLAQFQQNEMGLRAQQSLAALNAQQQAYALQSQQLEKASETQAQLDQLQRSAAGVSIQADQRRGAADAAVAQLGEQGADALGQMQQALTAAERKNLSLQSSGNLRTSSNETAKMRDLQQRLSAAFTMGANMDSAQVQAALQSLNEQDLATIGERLGLLDNATSAESVAANMRMLGISTDAGLQAVDSNYRNTFDSLNTARQQAGVMASLDMQNAYAQQQAQDYAYGVQRATNTGTGAQLQQLNQQAMGNIRGASLFDYLGTAVNATNAATMGRGGIAGMLQPRAPQVPLDVNLTSPTMYPPSYTTYGPNFPTVRGY